MVVFNLLDKVGNSLCLFRPRIECQAGSLHDSNLACLCRIGREIGFIDEALKSFVSRKIIQSFDPLHPSVSQNEALYHFEIPSMFSQVFTETKSGTR